ncbi:hypothetical protein E0W68_09570 [Flavobacterium salilacus subsp. salilacus]|uniref:hypothetical protein n=1 Tax=Flavobacterium TaxID=237 RepID=UPI001074A494|nr:MULTISPECIES: hypothetical protein [Flavobacterium]KAF2518263.1 hypothetical protein E0W68_09570 [Flavobacterium salilacus subsp. salilacus]MBE1615327.1 hypothetical protein [Flavobacterium sp. SaA2.13]
MKDIVRILEDLAVEKELEYHYGKKAALNLLDGSAEAGKTYLLHEFTNRKSEYNSTGTKITAVEYEGKFFLVKHADYDQHYFAETGTQATSKYVTNIEPLLQIFTQLGDRLACLGTVVTQWDNIDVTDALDANMDGLLCSYKIRIPHNYE